MLWVFRRYDYSFPLFTWCSKICYSNISSNEEKSFKIIAKSLLAYSDLELDTLIKEKALVEVENE